MLTESLNLSWFAVQHSFANLGISPCLFDFHIAGIYHSFIRSLLILLNAEILDLQLATKLVETLCL